ncbi:MAG: hypothetical protein EA425_02000 [Puniceicoccaceae bacterium]|nr:MAG: hypothetical protein EA425_02000 [Puniceicoccaceae bacterium]
MRPRSFSPHPLPMQHYPITDFGAVGDGTSNDAPAFQKAIDACSRDGGGRVVVPSGRVYRCGTFFLKDDVELHLERGARVLASPDREDYDEKFSVVVCALDARNIALTGGGEINGNGPSFMGEKLPHIYKKKQNGWRPFPIRFHDCTNVTIRDVLIRQSACWTLTLEGCEDAIISGIRLINDDLIPNDDGIDICNCNRVIISDCHVRAGDDAIVMKSMPNRRGGPTKPCENITVSNCVLESRSFGLSLGCEARAPLRNMTFDNVVIQNSHRGIGVHLSHGCDVENVVFSNMVVETRHFHPAWWGCAEPIYVVAIPWTPEEKIGAIRHVRFSNILCRSENSAVIYGWEPRNIENLVLDNVRIEIDRWSEFEGGRFDLRPFPGEDPRTNHLVDQPTSGFYVKNATDVTIRNCRVAWGDNRQQYHRHAIEAHGVKGIAIENFRGESAWPDRYEAIQKTED